MMQIQRKPRKFTLWPSQVQVKLAGFFLHQIAKTASLVPALLIGLFFLSSCQTTSQNAAVYGSEKKSQVPLSESLSSNYLMARHAIYGNDLPSATDFFNATLVKDSTNPALLRHSFLTHYQSGNIEQAADIARRMEALNFSIPLASEPALIEAALADDWNAVAVLSDTLSQSDTSIIIAGVARSWALFAQGQFAGAVGQMSQIADLLQDELGLTPIFMELQIAYLLEAAGKNQEAILYLNNLTNLYSYPPHIQLSIAAAYHRLGRKSKAQEILQTHLSSSFDVTAIVSTFQQGTNVLLQPLTVRRGLAQALLDTSWLDTEKSVRSLLLARAQLSLIIDPEFHAAHFVIAQEYLGMNQSQIATKHLAALTQKSPYYLPAQIMKISFLRRTDEHDAALSLVKDLRKARPTNQRLLLVESDILRSIDRCEEAVPLYKALLDSEFDTARLHRNLAICLERAAKTKADENEAESYFLSSLKRNPDDAYTLNYLGYWYADTNRNLDKAITYIKKALEIQPSSGFFVDSLGWVYYRLKDYELAVITLEKATQLEPLDAIITEHLGDAYWRVGREYEAIYKWQLALEQASDDELTNRLTEKLAIANAQSGDPLIYEAD